MNKKNYEKEQSRLNEILQQKTVEEQVTRGKLEKLSHEWDTVKKSRFLRLIDPREMKQLIRTVGAFALGRRNRKQLYSKTYKRKQAGNDLKPYVRALYNEGFTEKALDDLHGLLGETSNRYVKRAIAWELVFWYANQYTLQGAKQAIRYIHIAKQGERDQVRGRKLAIVEAECWERLDHKEKAKQVLHAQLEKQMHPDVYLGLANLETEEAAKLNWMNKTYEYFSLQPIYFADTNATIPYDRLRTAALTERKKGPKISVILPAYQAENGIQTAIESIQTQTWENIELLIVDDCSSDGTYEVAQSYAKKDTRIKVFQTKKNSGPYVARNLALAHATGEFVTVNDADDWSHAEKLAIQAEHLLAHPHVVANTSELVRLTEDLQAHRRGNQGKYLFSNMSSLMFRRDQVMEELGYWDAVRFAADGEFKRRLIHVFGKEAIVDLRTGPLSLPRQTASSLTGSSAFGYSGFFMGARKEYVESFSHYHRTARHLHYPQEQDERLFPVPLPMLPDRGKLERKVDVVMIADFYRLSKEQTTLLLKEMEKNQQLGLTTGLVQMSTYSLQKKKRFNEAVRNMIDGRTVQMLVYGEKIKTNIVIVRTPVILAHAQQYLPKVETLTALIIIDELPTIKYNGKVEQNYETRQCVHRLMTYLDKKGRWYPLNDTIRTALIQNYTHDIKAITMTTEDWINDEERNEEKYAIRIRDWLL